MTKADILQRLIKVHELGKPVDIDTFLENVSYSELEDIARAFDNLAALAKIKDTSN